MAEQQASLHATAIALEGRALLILGPSGSGKSSLALRMMALGAGLVADDVTLLTPGDGAPIAACPAAGIGILAAPAHPPCPVALVADLSRRERERIPPRRSVKLLGFDVALVHDPHTGDFATALYHYLRFGRLD